MNEILDARKIMVKPVAELFEQSRMAAKWIETVISIFETLDFWSRKTGGAVETGTIGLRHYPRSSLVPLQDR